MGRPSTYPTSTTKYIPEKCANGYTIFPGTKKGAVIIDMNGRVVRFFKDFQGMPHKMIKGGYVFGALGRRDATAAYQDYTDLTEVDWDGNIVWKFNQNEFVEDPGREPQWVARQHHDFQIEGNPVGYPVPGQESTNDFNKVMLLTHNNVKDERVSNELLMEDMVIIVDRQGNKIWEWHLLDHYDEFGLSDLQKKVIFDHPNMQNSRPEGEGDFFHVNSVSWLGPNKWYDQGDERFHPENMILSSREANIMFIIDHITGNIVYKLGPDYSDVPFGVLIGMHQAHMIPKGLPGEGNIIVYDNGGWAGYGEPTQMSPIGQKIDRRDFTRILEFDPITLEVVWSFGPEDMGAPEPFHKNWFYSPLVSNVQRFENGNTLIIEGTEGRILEVTREKEIVWEYTYPYVGSDILYRAYRVPYDWIPQLEKPNEVEIIPPENDTFVLPGACVADFDSVEVTVEGTRGYVEDGAFNVK